QNLDAILLAQAGLERLNLAASITEILDADWMLPAVGQGALGLECRADDRRALAVLARLDHAPPSRAVRAERSLRRGLGGGCAVPIGAATQLNRDALTLRGAVLSPDGSRRIADQITGPSGEAEILGQELAQRLLHQGARELLSEPRA